MKKSVIYFLTALLSLFYVQTSMAQAAQDALYIFRNDGQFDAFFFGDIDHIEYSKIDTLGVEQNDYVVQEVYALDSVYRIPISAIDSVSFVTPETKYKVDVFLPDKSIADYIVASDSVNWIRLATNTPSELIPKVGDKMFIKDASTFIPNGFVGLVTAVTNGSDGYTVMTGELEITDIFDRLVAKAAAATDGRNATRGLLDGTEMSYTTEEPIVIPELAGSIPFQGSYAIGSLGPVSFSGNVTGSLDYSIKEQWEIRAFLYVDAFTGQFQYDSKVRVIDDVSASASLTGSLSASLDIPFKKVGKKLSDFFKAEIGAGICLGAQFNALSVTYGRKFKTDQKSVLVYNDRDLTNQLNPHPSINYHTDVISDETECEADTDGKWSFTLGAYGEVNLGVAYPFKKTSPEEKSAGVAVKLRLEGGGKLEYDVPELGLSPLFPKRLLDTFDDYRTLNSLGNVSVMLYGKFALSGELGKWKGSVEPELDLLKTTLRGIVPNFKSISSGQDTTEPVRPYRIRLNSTASNDLITGRYIGFAVFNEDEELVADSLCDFYYKEELSVKRDQEGTSGCVFELDPGKGKVVAYTAYPMVEYAQQKILDGDHKTEFTLDPARIDIAQRLIEAGIEMGAASDNKIEVIPNMPNMEVKSEADWLEQVSWRDYENRVCIGWQELPEDVKERRGVVRLYGLSKSGEILVEDSIVVVQSSTYLELSPTKLEFDAKGGTKTVTIKKTNLKDLTLGRTSSYIHASIEGTTITVTVDENTNPEERSESVSVNGTTENGRMGGAIFDVVQAGTGQTPQPQPSLSGDSPFKYINFMAQVMTRSITEDVDTVGNAYYMFKFEDSNSKMTLKEYKDYNHYECQGYVEDEVTGERAATLSFDITKKDHIVKNLQFATDATTKQDMIFPGVGTIHMAFHNVASMSLNDIPLTTNGLAYKESKVSAAEGLKFTSFSSKTDANATYDVNSQFDPDNTGIAPVNQQTTSTLIDDAGNYIWLAIEYKEAPSSDITLEWPSEAVMSGLKSGGMPVYEGSAPPIVNGTYVMSPLTVTADLVDAKGELGGVDQFIIKLSGQNNGEVTFNSYIVASGESYEAGNDMKGLIKGNGDEFTICVPDGEGMAFIISGRIEDNAVTDLYLSSTSMDTPGQYIILKDGDGSSSKTQWSPAPSED